MKKEIKYKVGQKVKIGGNYPTLGRDSFIHVIKEYCTTHGTPDNYHLTTRAGCWEKSWLVPLKFSKKVTKPRVKPQKELVSGFRVARVVNGYLLTLGNEGAPFDKTRVFNTKARLIKWISEHI